MAAVVAFDDVGEVTQIASDLPKQVVEKPFCQGEETFLSELAVAASVVVDAVGVACD